MSHTKGKWIVRNHMSGGEKPERLGIHIVGEDGEPLAFVPCEDVLRIEVRLEQESNAERICQMNSSYDELLDACKIAEEVLSLTNGDEGTGYRKMLDEAQVKIPAAIAKAENK